MSRDELRKRVDKTREYRSKHFVDDAQLYARVLDALLGDERAREALDKALGPVE